MKGKCICYSEVKPQPASHTNHNSVTIVPTPRHTSNWSDLDHESQTHELQPQAKHESERMTPPHGNGLLADQANIQPGQHNTRTTSQPRSHGQKVQLPLHKNKSNNCGDQLTPHLQTHSCRPMPGTSRVSGRSTLK
ncbi:hypothetical protein Taro_001080 [Colocasia esculenta]|uniref:Uncharacterized protein n=1 Tax=Colocasia esculenta TaxID=4460 RepID=A0A843TDS0_COLES|nr:hypothetical protein [Colocasia esculenta]